MNLKLVGPIRDPEIIPIKRGRSIESEVAARLNSLSCKTPLFLHAPPGAGKTYTVGHQLIPWARERGVNVLFICPRIATSIQAKRDFAQMIGEGQRLLELTDEGLRRQETFGNVTILTYQKLYYLMENERNDLSKYGLLVFDEIHCLLDDALFASCTGFILNKIHKHFKMAVRVYLSATPQAILPLLAKEEAPCQIQVLRFPTDYSTIRLWFFHSVDELSQRINEDSSQNKWLIYMPTIAAGQQLKLQLRCSVRLLNSQEREKDQEGWNTILKEACFEEKVAICTAVVDVGVNLKDHSLRNIVVFSLNQNTIIQFLGRKRRAASEKVNLYVWCPSQQDLAVELYQNEALSKSVDLYNEDYPQFIRQHILPSQEQDLRNWVYTDENGTLRLNPLVHESLHNQRIYLEKLMQRAKQNNGDCGFDKLIAQLFRIRLPDRSECWLDPRYNGASRAEFEKLLENFMGKDMTDDEFSTFCEQFQRTCVATYGTNGGKDRTDRPWKAKKIINKLRELDIGYRLLVDPITKVARIELSSAEPDVK